MKRIIVCIISILLVCAIATTVLGEGFLPSLDQVLGINLPYISIIINREPTKKYTQNDDRTIEEYADFSPESYLAVGKSFAKSGFVLQSERFSNGVLQLVLEKKNSVVNIEYNTIEQHLKVIYPKYYTNDELCYSYTESDDSLFPDFEKYVEAILPRLSTVLKKGPDSSQNSNGRLIERYDNFTEDHYNQVSTYLLEQGCTVKDYKTEGRELIIHLQKKGTEFVLKYDPSKSQASVEYSNTSYIEPIITATPKPTSTPKPTIDPATYNTYAALFVTVVKGTRTNPASLQIHDIRVMKYKENDYIVIDFSSMNGFGGYIRETYSFKFEYNHISFDGTSSDYDAYEKHQKEFSLITYLDVDDVMRLVK